MHGRHGIVRGSARRASGPEARSGAPVGTMKSRWRTRANALTAPTKATTAPITIRWFKVMEKPEW